MNNTKHRMQAGHTWNDVKAFLANLKPTVNCVITCDDEGRCKIRYTLGRDHTPVAESFFSLRHGWQYALLPGIEPGAKPAAQAAVALSKATAHGIN